MAANHGGFSAFVFMSSLGDGWLTVSYQLQLMDISTQQLPIARHCWNIQPTMSNHSVTMDISTQQLIA
jgi:hypothetical protein